MKKQSLRQFLASPILEKEVQIMSCYYLQQIEDSFVGYYQGLKLTYNMIGNQIKSEKSDFQNTSKDFWFSQTFPIVTVNEIKYVVSPTQQSLPSKIYRIEQNNLVEIFTLPFTISTGFSYCYYPKNSLLIRDDDLCYYEFDFNTNTLKLAHKKFQKQDMELFWIDESLYLLQKRSLYILIINMSGKIDKCEIKNGQDLGFHGFRTVGKIPINWIQDFQTVLYNKKFDILICKVFLHGEDVINYIEQKKQVQQKIQLHPELYVSKKDLKLVDTRYIVPTSDVDVFNSDFTPALMPNKELNDQMLIERTDPRMCIYISNLSFYQNLRSLYEKGYMLIDLKNKQMYLYENSIEVLSLDTKLEERFQLMADTICLAKFISSYYPQFKNPVIDQIIQEINDQSQYKRHNSLTELEQSQ